MMDMPARTAISSTRHSNSTLTARQSSTGSAAHESPRRSKAGNASSSSSAAQAASSLALLLREDQMLTKFNMHAGSGQEPAFQYAAALLEVDDHKNHQQRAEDALGEVDRKLALVESLAERVSRTSPEAVAGPLLRLHGYAVNPEDGDENGLAMGSSGYSGGTTLLATRERCDRLKRQGEVLEGVASRVETSLMRGMNRMDKATKRLSRVLQLSASLKMILRLQFEASKLEGFYLDDLRDLTRAAASVAVIEDLLAKPELKDGPKIDIVEAVRPQAEKTGVAVRKAAGELLAKHQVSNSSSSSAVLQLGATLQVYFHLGELPLAAWGAVNHAIVAAEKVSNEFWSPTTLSNLNESATTKAKLASGSGKKMSDASVQRTFKAKLKELRSEAASKWARGIMDASLQVWNLHQVLCRKSDPVSRQLFVDVVAAAAIPEKYELYRPPGAEQEDFSIFSLYWERLCHKMGDRLKHILEYENGKFAPSVSELYPAVRAASINMLASLNDAMQAGLGSITLEDATSSSSNGVLGGSAGLNDSFLQWSTTTAEATQSAGQTTTSADTWTIVKKGDGASSADRFQSTGSTSLSTVMNSPEWLALQGNHASSKGLFRLQRAFLEASNERLCSPLQFMFQENITVDDAGYAISHLPLLPSRYDIQKIEANIRQELSLADPREGGGDLSAITMIAENVIHMISKFCEQARNAVSNASDDACLNPKDGTPTEALLHDMKVSKIMNAMAEALRTAPERVFLEPYRPAVTAKLEEAASICEQALKPGLLEIDSFVREHVLGPLCRAINQRIAATISRMHYGSYMQESGPVGDLENEAPSFAQKYLSGLYEKLGSDHLSKLPKRYSSEAAENIATFSVFTFISNAALMRPFVESTRLHMTQDLADFELLLEQLMVKGGQVSKLSEIANGKPYAELRAVREMLFWTGLDDQSKASASISKALLRENWIRNVRPSTICHYLFSYGPSLLSSPHHFKRLRVEQYVQTLVSLDAEVEEGEASAWMTTMACCDSYQQRESAQQVDKDGDSRIASILMSLGPELLRRRRT